jgi:hypothetical protein
MAGNRQKEILSAYEAWDPDEETVASLVERIGISRQRLYDVLDKGGVTPKSRRTSQRRSQLDSDILSEMAEMALGYLLGQLQDARNELASYRDRYGPLDS